MPSSDNITTGRLLEQLAIELMQQFPSANLRTFGWFDFRAIDRPDTPVPTKFAADAFCYLSLDEDGTWRRNVGVLTAVLAFLKKFYPDGSSVHDLQQLKPILEATPVQQSALIAWFLAVYPPDCSARN